MISLHCQTLFSRDKPYVAMGQMGHELGMGFGAVDLCVATGEMRVLGHMGHEFYLWSKINILYIRTGMNAIGVSASQFLWGDNLTQMTHKPPRP